MSCPTCFSVNVRTCSDAIIVKAGLQPHHNYFWLLKNKFGKFYQRQMETNDDGDLAIDLSALPAGATNQFSGPWELSLRDGDNYLDEVIMEINGQEYACALIDFTDINEGEVIPEDGIYGIEYDEEYQ